MNLDQMCIDATRAIKHHIGVACLTHRLEIGLQFHEARVRLGLAVPVSRVSVRQQPEPIRGGAGGAVHFHNVDRSVARGHFDNSYVLHHVSVGGGGGYDCGSSSSDSCASGD